MQYPVDYQQVYRQIRVSKNAETVKAYLKDMYEVLRGTYVCQMCLKPYHHIEAVQIDRKMNLELDQMYLCLCSNCANNYRELRNIDQYLEDFLEKIKNNNIYEFNKPVVVAIANQKVYFTITHYSEIHEILKYTSEHPISVM